VHAIDEEVRKIIDSAYGHATKILTDHFEQLHTMAAALIRYETIDQEQIKAIMAGREPQPPEGWGSGDGPVEPVAPAVSGVAQKDGKPDIGKPAEQH
jgi:cell division protease FtsH